MGHPSRSRISSVLGVAGWAAVGLAVLTLGCSGGDSAIDQTVYLPDTPEDLGVPAEAGLETGADVDLDASSDTVKQEAASDAQDAGKDAIADAQDGGEGDGPADASEESLPDAEEDSADGSLQDADDEDSSVDALDEAVPCSQLPELCNGLDDNCNGAKDEGNPGGGEGCTIPNKLGECAKGTTYCSNASIKCIANAPPIAEICDGKDNDCDGAVDNNASGTGAACNSSLPGICKPGSIQCIGGSLVCFPDEQPVQETCNGLDDDCDGTVDNGYPGAGQPCTVAGQNPNTPCAQGQTTCMGGQNACAQVSFPEPEKCDGKDNDCNMTIDDPATLNGLSCNTGLPGICSTGKTQCESGVLKCAADVQPGSVVESCNGKDDDCNGVADDGANIKVECAVKNPGALNVADWKCSAGICEVFACVAGFKDCDGMPTNGCEVNASTDINHCGTCGNGCSASNGSAMCSLGQCVIVCNPGWGNCDGDAANGCEVPLISDANNCGVCGKQCDGSTGTPTCNNGACSIACNPGLGDCDGNGQNGCETNLLTDPTRCGTCTTVCSSVGGTPLCAAGQCSTVCAAGKGNCDNIALNGCETDLATSAQHCGVCGGACSAINGAPSCAAGQCQISCNTGWGNCDGAAANGCESPLNVPSTCGSCTNTCVNDNGTTSCIAGACVPSCAAFFASCDGNPANGCETDLKTLQNCGTCGMPCAPAHATGSCAAGTCSVVACDIGWGDCDGSDSNGCESNLTTSVAHCGGCGMACSSANGTPACTAGVCAISCSPGYGDCDGSSATGCEASLLTSTQNCGTCGKVCTFAFATPVCTSGACHISSCASGRGDCDGEESTGCETLLNTNTNCGVCGGSCSLPNATSTCASGSCGIASCNPGFADCDGQVANGCEVNLQTSASNCGACGTACNATNGTPSCVMGSCSISCQAGWGNCDGSVANGCETQLNTTADCGACGKLCSNNNGTTGCTAGVCTPTCSSGWADCDGNPANGCETDLLGSALHCGGCGKTCVNPNGTTSCIAGACAPVCTSGYASCDGNPQNGCETSTQSSSANCGACGAQCINPNGTTSCVAGACVPVCATGYASCDGIASNGCETNTQVSTSHCGACGTVCGAVNGTAVCALGSCGLTCNAGYGNCDGQLSNGCETPLNTTSNCGTCAATCTNPNGPTACTAGACTPSCNTGYGSCDGNAANGCEANLLTSAVNCGACGTSCSNPNGTTSCVAGICSPVCASGFGNCDSNPVNGCETALQTSIANCGACGTTCTNGHGTVVCTSGVCAPTCTSGWGNCDGDAVNGCETNLLTSATHCGTCSKVCTCPSGLPTCSNGTCGCASCATGFGDCDGQSSNGCETPLNTLANCGACNTVCDLANATESCSTGTCALSACNAGWGNCDGNPSNGCETNTSTNVSNCGTCGAVCNSTNGTASCVAGSCNIACSIGFGNCDNNVANGCEAVLSTTANCGACGQACTNANGTTACASGVCTPVCTAGYANCDGNPNNGCETSTLTSAANCGGCGVACTNANGTTSCVAGACVPVCAAGYGNCDSNAQNGCETNTSTNVSNCGGCAMPCTNANGTTSCVAGACQPVCNAGFASCDGNARNGCETNTATSTTNCGGCGTVCTGINGTASCSAGVCSIACNSGWGNCDGVGSNGCETQLNTLTNCGGCGVACTNANGSTACTGGVCVPSCANGYASCDGNPNNGCESYLRTDPLNCGSCGTTCVYANATGTCANSKCAFGTCDSGWANCDGATANGCEANIESSVTSCGSCTTVCTNANGTTSCAGGACVPVCSAGFASCDGNVVNGCETSLKTSTNCGACGVTCNLANATSSCATGTCVLQSCSTGYSNCDGTISNGCEVNTQTSTANCGACGQACSANHGTASCSLGNCAIACSAGWGNCDGDARTNGCETSLYSTSNCGACGTVCTNANGTTTCPSGVCVPACSAGFGSCDGNVVNGCETNLQTSVSNCGACGTLCTNPNGSTSCVSGVCTPICSAGWADCDGNKNNGCETNKNTSVTNCGGCGITCTNSHGTTLCSSGACVPTCLSGWGNCDSNPVNGCETSLTSITNCGSCGTACSPANATGTCTTGACAVLSCNAGWGNCDGLVSNGCEAQLNTVTACGSCSTQCTNPNGTTACTSGVCVPTCTNGFGNCDGNPNNGCESYLKTDPLNCGACGAACTYANATGVCSNSKCSFGACNTGYANCDGTATNGCEVNTQTDPNNCGGCGTVCASGICVSGVCSTTCPAGWGNCDGNPVNGCETQLNSLTNCGACGVPCSRANATATCSTGTCQIATCNSGWGNCDGNAVNGCETALNTTSNCGSCGTTCVLANATSTCSLGSCLVQSCNAGYANCDGNHANGCEVNTQTTVAHCGGCSQACSTANGTASCSLGSCLIACSAGFANCDGNARTNGCEVNLNADPSNCGTCGHVCGGSLACIGGTCQASTLLGTGTGPDPYRQVPALSSCLAYKTTYGAQAVDGVYMTHPSTSDIKVYCDMTGGGYTYEAFGLGQHNASYSGWAVVGGADFEASARFRAAFEFHYNTLGGLINVAPGFTSSNCCVMNPAGRFGLAGVAYMYPASVSNTTMCNPSGGYVAPIIRLYLVSLSQYRASFTQAELADVQYYAGCSVANNPGIFVKRYL